MMTGVLFTPSQKQRLAELNAPPEVLTSCFKSTKERDEKFRLLFDSLVKKNINRIEEYLCKKRRPLLRIVEEKLKEIATKLGFSEVVTPTIIPKSFIYKMGINERSPLWKQIMWLDEKRALRPMLAPSLYVVMRALLKYTHPVKIFEIGSCFRKDTRSKLHLEEFTMMNMVEVSPIDEEVSEDKLLTYIDKIMKEFGLKYEITFEQSEVYGETLDVKVKGYEVASAAIGPKPIDVNWDMNCKWIGIGFGVERLAMVIGNYASVAKVGRSLNYLNGNKLNVKKC